MRLLNLHRQDQQNAGDMMSSPFRYFQFADGQETMDVLEAKKISDFSGYDAVIIGGGGLLQDEWFMPALAHVRKSCPNKVIAWGLGLNTHFYSETIYFAPQWSMRRQLLKQKLFGRRPWRIRRLTQPDSLPPGCVDWLKTCDLAGVRDHGIGHDWVPCASCMDNRIERYRNLPPQHDLIAVDHPHFCRIELAGVPRAANIGNDFETMLAFLASGDTVLCASYHAAYWALLLNRKVIVVPWSEKFLRLKYDLPVCTKKSELERCRRRARAFPEALAECRERNISFAAKVSRLLKLDLVLAPDSTVAPR